jgi:cell division protein FtsZ
MDEIESKSEVYDVFLPKMAVVGVGGGGNNTVNRISNLNIKDVELFAFNTDKKQLAMLNHNIHRIVLGEAITYGLGAGGFPEIGEKAANLTKDKISGLLDGIDLLFLTAGMGGGTGTGASPVIAEIAKEKGTVIIGIVTIPFALERVRFEVAKKGITKLRRHVDTLIVIDNQRLVTLYPNLGLEKAFMLADEITSKAVRGISQAITQPSMINLDFADIKTIMSSGGLSMISVGIGEGTDKIEEVVESTLKNKLLDVDYTTATGALFHITGGADMTLGDANKIGEKLTEFMPQTANVTWGARIDESYKGKIEVIAIFTGVQGSSIIENNQNEDNKLEFSDF